MTFMLTGVTIIALLSLSSLVIAPVPIIAREHPSDLVRRFYAATNAILAGNSPAALEKTVAPGLIEHPPGMPSGDRAALVRRLSSLHRAAPGVQLGLLSSVEDGAWAAARVRPLGLRPIVHGVPLDLAPEPPAQTEFFRIDDGKIVEYWPGGTVIAVPQALPPIAATPWFTDTAVSLAQLTFPSGAGLSDLHSRVEHLILLESGELSVSLSGPASLFEVARPDAGWQARLESGQELALRAGDALLIAPGTRHSIANVHAGSATMLGVEMFPIVAPNPTKHQGPADPSQLAGIYDPRWVNTWATSDRHVVSNVVAVGIAVARTGPCTAVAQTQVSVTRFSLGPGEGLPAHPVAGIELMAINPGGLEVATPNAASASTPAAAPGTVSNAPLRNADGLFFSPPSAPPLRNAGPFPLKLVGIALQPAGGTGCAVAPVDS
jgi:predicted SnoaL-like aldol condensation-catalyzing enzyme